MQASQSHSSDEVDPSNSSQLPPFSSLCPSNNTSTNIIETDNTDTLDSSKPSATDNNDHNRTYDPGGLSNSNSKLVYDPGAPEAGTASIPRTAHRATMATVAATATTRPALPTFTTVPSTTTTRPASQPSTSTPAFDSCKSSAYFKLTPPLHATDNLPAILQDGSKCTDEAQRLSLEHQEHPLDFDLARASTSNITHTPPASRLDNDNSNNSIDAAPIFDTNSADNSNGNSSNATNIVNTRIIIASAASSSSSSHGNTIGINAETFDSDSTDISPTISVSTTARENEPKPECARTPPLEVSTQAPPQD